MWGSLEIVKYKSNLNLNLGVPSIGSKIEETRADIPQD
jgi:hypothetical protein